MAHVGDLMERWPLKGRSVLLVDKTGVGAPVCDMFVRANLNPFAITITGGKEVHAEGNEIHVPKRDLAIAGASAPTESAPGVCGWPALD